MGGDRMLSWPDEESFQCCAGCRWTVNARRERLSALVWWFGCRVICGGLWREMVSGDSCLQGLGCLVLESRLTECQCNMGITRGISRAERLSLSEFWHKGRSLVFKPFICWCDLSGIRSMYMKCRQYRKANYQHR